MMILWVTNLENGIEITKCAWFNICENQHLFKAGMAKSKNLRQPGAIRCYVSKLAQAKKLQRATKKNKPNHTHKLANVR